MTLKNAFLLTTLTLVSAIAMAQGEIDSQTIEISKKKKIELPPANRLYNKIQPFTNDAENKRIDYEFKAPKLNLGSPKMTPNVMPVNNGKKEEEEQSQLENYAKIAAGNYGKVYGETFFGGQSENAGFDLHYKHLSNQTGPVNDKNSGNSENRLKINGQYVVGAFKLGAMVSYDRDNFYFYGQRNAPERTAIQQTINTIGAQLSFENTDNTTLVDYTIKTGLHRLNDRYSAAETDWSTNFTGAIPITEHIYALVGADAHISQRSDLETFSRNLFRVKPAFKFVYPKFAVTVAAKAVNETDDRFKINRTVGFPTVEVDVIPFSGIHFYAGYDGDINRNTLRSMLGENRWLSPNVVIANTEKNKDIYGGFKGELGAGFQFETKASFATFKNFYGFNNDWIDTTKFAVLYDADYINVLTVSGQIGYTYKDMVRSTFRLDFSDFNTKRLETIWGRPNLTANWNNSFIFSKKLFATIDVYYLSGMKNKNFKTNRVTTIKPITDLNIKIDYLLTRNFSAFVSINNFLGKTYDRYLYYPQQGLNFLGGLSVQF
jgi:hypothetical protein